MTPWFRVLGTLDKFRLRLGWVRFLLAQSAAEGGPSAVVGDTLSSATDLQTDWLSAAGITKPPLGKYSKRAEKPLLRMGVDLDLWGPSTPRRLTDLGEVTRIVAGEWGASPFAWSQSSRFIGLRLVLGADGDVLLPLLRDWPDDGTADALRSSIASVLSGLAALAPTDEERHALDRQAQRTLTDSSGKVLWPRLEPLRELGYLDCGDTAGSYRLSGLGLPVKEWLRENAELGGNDLVGRFLPQLHAAGEGMELGEAAGPEALRYALRGLPAALTSGGTAAGIEPIALLVHSHFLETGDGGWTSPEHLRALVRRLAKHSEGMITLQNAGSQLAANVAWQDSTVLAVASYWQLPATAPVGFGDRVPLPPRDSETGPGVSHDSAVRPPRDKPAITVKAVEETDDLDETETPRVAESAGEAQSADEAESTDEAQSADEPDPADEAGAPDEPESPDQAGSADEAQASGGTDGDEAPPPLPNLQAWWAHVLRLVHSDRLAGDNVLHGGPETMLKQFGLALIEGTERSLEKQRRDAAFSGCLDLWLKPLEVALDTGSVRPEAEQVRPLVGLMRRFKVDWGSPDEVSRRAARATLDLLGGDRLRRQHVLRAWLLAVLRDQTPASAEEWSAVRTISRGFIDDALHVMRTGEGILRSPETGLAGARAVIDLMLEPAEEMPASLEVTVLLGEKADHDIVYQRAGELDPNRVGGTVVKVLDIVRPVRVDVDSEAGAGPSSTAEMDVVVTMNVRAEGEDEAQAIAAKCASSFMLELRGLLPVAVAARTSVIRATASAVPAALAAELGPSWDRYGLPPKTHFDVVDAPGPDRIGALLDGPRDRARLDLLMERLLVVRSHEPFEGISSLWDAAEQCSQGSGGEYFPRLLAAVSLVRTRRTIRETHLELLWGLVLAGREGESSSDYHDLVATWYGRESRDLVEHSERGAFLPFPNRPRIGDTHSCEALFANWQYLEQTASLLEHHCPYVSRHIRAWMKAFGSGSAFSAWSERSRLETSAFVRQIYDVRNRTRHQGGADHACQPQAERFSTLCRLVLDELIWEAASGSGTLSDVWDRVVQRDRMVRRYAKDEGNRYLRAASLLEHRLVPKARVEAERALK